MLPREPVDTFIDPLSRFLHIEAAGGIVLLVATALALLLANTPAAEAFLGFWKVKVGFTVGDFQIVHSLQHWINDLLMAVFFFVIGLEVKRELVLGELKDLRQAALPVAAAIGGMIIPACVYLMLQAGTPAARGWGIPMATDIAFVVGCLAILGNRVPNSLRVFLLSLAIADDIGAILVIAVGYTGAIRWGAAIIGVGGVILFLAMFRVGIRNTAIGFTIALLTWFGFHESGIHATIAGVIIGLLCPTTSWVSENRLIRIARRTLHILQGEGWDSAEDKYAMLRQMERAARKTLSPIERFEIQLHPWVGFLFMPLFALANAGVTIHASELTNPVAIAVGLGLFVGKPMGILLFSYLAVKFGFASLPQGISWKVVFGGGCLAGIGFTMALFVGNLALGGSLLNAAKVGIIMASVGSALAGITLLSKFLPKTEDL